MGDVHAPLLRPAGAPRGLRPAARGGGAPARRVTIAALAIGLWAATAAPAAADTLDPAGYQARLREVRALVSQGRLDAARALLRRTDALRVGTDTIAIDDRALAERLGSGPDAIADLDRRIAAAERAASRPVDGASADARLRALLAERGGSGGAGSFMALFVALAERIFAAFGRPDPSAIFPAQMLVGGALALVLVAIIVRGVRDRLRIEVELPEARAQRRDEPRARLEDAAAAAARGDLRAAIHAYYRFALASLAARDAFVYDPALTDREVLARAAGLAHVDALRELVALNDRVWFGLRTPAPADVARAERLARTAAG